MKNNRYKIMSIFLRFSLEFVFYAGLVLTIAIPFVVHYWPEMVYRYFWWFYSSSWISRELFTLSLIELLGVAALIIVRQLVLIFKSVNEDKPFIKQNADRLKRISVCCFSMFGIFLFKITFFYTPLSFLMTVALLIASFAALVFSRLFYLAVEYKSENDLTI